MKYLVITMFVLLAGCGRGPVGVPGPKGDTGAQGVQGEAGTDATPVTIVQLCPGTTTYSSKFVEIAFCVGGRLYGTYSQNGGFSTELPPGSYSSNGINSSCSFIIYADCIVSY